MTVKDYEDCLDSIHQNLIELYMNVKVRAEDEVRSPANNHLD
jgi:hypothetical protein